MNDITKSDWKLFQERVPEWQEHYMERLIKEYVELLNKYKDIEILEFIGVKKPKPEDVAVA